MADAKSDYLERKVLDHVLGTAPMTSPSAVYAALFTSSQDDEDSATEVSGGSYSRQEVGFSAASTDGSGVTTASNASDLVWTNLPSTTLVAVGIYDASTDGNLLYYADLTSSKVIELGDGYTISTGQLVITEN